MARLQLNVGDVPLREVRLLIAGRDWSILHTAAILTVADEQRFIREGMPYGAALWPAAVALAHEVAARAAALPGHRVLELGAGTGLPGLVAASLGARVVQTDNHEVALHVCRLNAQGNGVLGIEHRLADWTTFADQTRYDLILGADVLYATAMHDHLAAIFERSLAKDGRVLLADPLRTTSLPLLQRMEAQGWRVVMGTWTVGEETAPRTVSVYELSRG